MKEWKLKVAERKERKQNEIRHLYSLGRFGDPLEIRRLLFHLSACLLDADDFREIVFAINSYSGIHKTYICCFFYPPARSWKSSIRVHPRLSHSRVSERASYRSVQKREWMIFLTFFLFSFLSPPHKRKHLGGPDKGIFIWKTLGEWRIRRCLQRSRFQATPLLRIPTWDVHCFSSRIPGESAALPSNHRDRGCKIPMLNQTPSESWCGFSYCNEP